MNVIDKNERLNGKIEIYYLIADYEHVKSRSVSRYYSGLIDTF